MQLSDHFTRAEFTRSQTAARMGIPNEPGPRQWDLIQLLCELVLEPARAVVGPIWVTSGYRSPATDQAVKGSDLPTTSDHQALEDACAADVVAADLGDLFRYIYVQLPWSRLIWEFGEWVHVSFHRGQVLRTRKPLAAFVVPDGDGKKTVYRPMGFDEIYSLGRAELETRW